MVTSKTGVALGILTIINCCPYLIFYNSVTVISLQTVLDCHSSSEIAERTTKRASALFATTSISKILISMEWPSWKTSSVPLIPPTSDLTLWNARTVSAYEHPAVSLTKTGLLTFWLVAFYLLFSWFLQSPLAAWLLHSSLGVPPFTCSCCLCDEQPVIALLLP